MAFEARFSPPAYRRFFLLQPPFEVADVVTAEGVLVQRRIGFYADPEHWWGFMFACKQQQIKQEALLIGTSLEHSGALGSTECV